MSNQPSTPVKVPPAAASYTPATMDPELRSQINAVLLRDGHVLKYVFVSLVCVVALLAAPESTTLQFRNSPLHAPEERRTEVLCFAPQICHNMAPSLAGNADLNQESKSTSSTPSTPIPTTGRQWSRTTPSTSSAPAKSPPSPRSSDE